MTSIKLNFDTNTNYVNPWTGFAFFDTTSEAKANPNTHSIRFLYCYPDEVCTGYNALTKTFSFDWSALDLRLKVINDAGCYAVVRFAFTMPNESHVPKVLKEMPGYSEKKYADNTTYPNTSFPPLQKFMYDIVKSFSLKYDSDVPLKVCILQGFCNGVWNENHCSPNTPELGVNMWSYDFQEQFCTWVSKSGEVLKNIWFDIGISCGTPVYGKPGLYQSLPNIGYFSDSEFSKKYGVYNDQLMKTLDWNKKVLTAMHFGEVATTSSIRDNILAVNGPEGIPLKQMVENDHLSSILCNSILRKYTPKDVIKASECFGYKFEISECSALLTGAEGAKGTGAKVIVNVKLSNVGVAPFYYEAYLTLNGIKSTQNLKFLAQNTSILCSFELDSGSTGPEANWSITCPNARRPIGLQGKSLGIEYKDFMPASRPRKCRCPDCKCLCKCNGCDCGAESAKGTGTLAPQIN